MKRKFSRAAWLIAPVLLTVSVAGLGQPAAGDDGRHTNGAPDTYVAAWDAVGVQAFSAAGLSPAEGHTIFAYLGVAVYDAVMAVEGGYEPFAVDLDAPAGASSQAAVAAAARGILVHYLPAQAATIIEPAYAASLATIADGQAETDGVATGDAVARRWIDLRSDDGFRAGVTYTPPNPPIAGRVAPDRTDAADRSVPQADGSVQPALRRPVPTGRTATPRQPALGRRLQRGQRDRLRHEHHSHRRADAGCTVLGRSTRSAGPWIVPQVRGSTTNSTSSTRPGSTRCGR